MSTSSANTRISYQADALALAGEVEAQLADEHVDPATIRRLIAAVRRER